MMMTEIKPRTIRVLCVDDNPMVSEALNVQFRDIPDIKLMGTAATADELLIKAAQDCPDIVLLDYDMPGKPAFTAISELESVCAESRVLMYSGYIRRELVQQALECGAWGYVAKVDSLDDLINAIRKVAGGSLAFSPAVNALNGCD